MSDYLTKRADFLYALYKNLKEQIENSDDPNIFSEEKHSVEINGKTVLKLKSIAKSIYKEVAEFKKYVEKNNV